MTQETLALHAGYDKGEFGAMSVPIYQNTAYDFGTAKKAADRFSLADLGPIYTRLNNPTTSIFENRVAAVEGGESAVATATGQAAIFCAVANLAQVGENIIIAQKIYGGATTLLAHTIKRFGIEAKIFDSDNADDLEDLIDDKTKAIFFESLSNPQIAVPDIQKITRIANKYNIITICDNTVATPALFKPFDHDVDVIVHSASKYINGNGSTLGGVVVARHGLNKKIIDNARYPHFNEPDESYHGLVYSSVDLPLFTLRITFSLIRDMGFTISPNSSWILLQGLETLHIRMKQHSTNALIIAKYLQSHPKVKSVSYPGLDNNQYNSRVKKYFKDSQASGLLSFEVEDLESAKSVIDNTKLFAVVVNIGDSKSIITHPASTTHMQVSPDELAKSGITPELIRLSVGLEDTDDLIADLAQAIG
ncbi:MAG: O-acetylhomoserine aminocarboxypropyltransferase/cysteine synthase [Sulfurospirillum sp.]|nr:O-acetylhomoserine aminocarboxypropyltransferase/cysteine synthase [Sulfurospirillum sp.]MBL0702985.1 O-acetylhomoserine aminocarboxypropyltransferase/cysteine synthase [Sulfurospirillum sp.]